MASGRIEQPQHRVAGLGRALERLAPFTQRGVGVDSLGGGHRAEVAATLVQYERDARAGLEPPTEPRASPSNPLGDRADTAAFAGVEMQNAVGLAEADRAQDDRFRLEGPGHQPTLEDASDALRRRGGGWQRSQT